MRKVIKSTPEKLKEKGIFSTPLNLPFIDWYEKTIEAKKEAIEKSRKEEENRINKIKCPSCKSTSKDHIQNREDNGIIGPGYRSWIVDEYFVCKKCGTMYKDLNKNKK